MIRPICGINPLLKKIACQLLFTFGALSSAAFAVEERAGAAIYEQTDLLVPARRVALVIGANRAKGLTSLRFAEKDAQRFTDVLVELGEIPRENVTLLLQPSVVQVLAALNTWAPQKQELETRVMERKTTDSSQEILVYFSGHADANALLLGNERLEYALLRGRLKSLNSKLRIVVLDACGSGGFVQPTSERGKGTRPVRSFLSPQDDVQGYAFLSSSTADESSQESDDIEASFFTHALISGLRGAADSNGDQKVTLREAYAFAYDETLQKTAATQLGPQHATYDIHLEGQGSVLLSNLRQTNSTLMIPADVNGHIIVRDAQHHLWAEFTKIAGKPVHLALPRRRFEVQILSNTLLRVAHSTTDEREQPLWENLRFTTTKRVWASAKGASYLRKVQEHNEKALRVLRYKDEKLRVVQGQLFEEPFFAFRGDRQKAIGRRDFYQRIGLKGLEDKYINQLWLKYAVKNGALLSSLTLMIGGIAPLFIYASLPPSGGNIGVAVGVGVLVAYLTGFTLGITALSAGLLIQFLFFADPIDFLTAQKLTKEHNVELLERFGLTEDDLVKVEAVNRKKIEAESTPTTSRHFQQRLLAHTFADVARKEFK